MSGSTIGEDSTILEKEDIVFVAKLRYSLTPIISDNLRKYSIY